MAISTNVEAQREIDEEIEVHMMVVRRLLKQRNTYSAVYQLPNEILAEFFILATAEDWRITDTLLNIASVCAHWRQICLATPQLWTIICFDHPRWCAELLSRAQGCPLNVYLLERNGLDEDFERATTMVVPETSRFTNVEIHDVDYNGNAVASSFLRTSFALPAPLLRDAVVRMKQTEPCAILGNLWPELNSLRSLDLNNALPMTTSLMPSLTYLRIDIWGHGNRLSVLWLLDLLRNTPQLKSLNIRVISSDFPFVVMDVLPISLPNLQSLVLSMKGLRELKLLPFLELPALKMVCLTILPLNDETSLETHTLTLLPSFIASRISPDVSSINVRVRRDAIDSNATILEFQMMGAVDEDPLHLHLDFQTSELNRVDLVSSLPLGKIRELAIVCPMNDEEILAWSETIPLCSHLRELEVSDVAFLLSVAVVREDSSGRTSGTFVHPELEEISIYWDNRSTPRNWAQFIRVCQYHHERGKRMQLNIGRCDIPISYAERLKAYTDLDWDEEGSAELVEPFEELHIDE
ncbi:hypothetical protein ONZ45_g10839 [Pleurotus djamor]|nr:hypothetical protein ONZ45_g10839 [Pleurotus djamor]